MRACVLLAAPTLALITLITALPACRANPGFMLRDDGGDADSTGTGATGETSASGSSTGAELCEPINTATGTVCTPDFELLPLTRAIVDFSDAAILGATQNVCDAFDGFVVKRVDDELQRCDDNCEGCDPSTALDVGPLAKLPNFAKLLPGPDTCAIMWHISRPNPDPIPDDPVEAEDRLPCATSGFLIMDDTPERLLRVAVAFDSADPDPFAGQPDSPLTVARNDEIFDNCTNQIGDNACVGGFTPQGLSFTLGRCNVETHQSLSTTALSTGAADFTLELHNAYRCIDGRQNYRWWIRRQF